MQKRYLEDLIRNDALAVKKIAFISGPRQVGKTTLARSLLEKLEADSTSYYTWDDDEFRKVWTKSPKSILDGLKSKYLVLDEIHKERTWKNKLKGLYDLYGEDYQFIVTGSARIDYYRKSGDSLQGRYFPYRLHPFTLCESPTVKLPPKTEWLENASPSIVNLDQLELLGGFPEPLWGQSEEKARRWRRLYRDRMIREDARDIQNIKEINSLDVLSLLLQERAGSQLSYESLREDIGSSHDTITRWIGILEALYYCYRIKPFSKNIKYSLKKEPKLFLYDWGFCSTGGAKWENMIAGHLLKNVHLWTDAAMGEFDLFYLRDKQKREVDFLVTKNKKPWLMVEVKSNSNKISPALNYFYNLLKPQFCFQVVREKKQEKPRSLEHPHIQIISAESFLSALN